MRSNVDLVEHRTYGPPHPSDGGWGQGTVLPASGSGFSAIVYPGSSWPSGSIAPSIAQKWSGVKMVTHFRTWGAVVACDLLLLFAYVTMVSK